MFGILLLHVVSYFCRIVVFVGSPLAGLNRNMRGNELVVVEDCHLRVDFPRLYVFAAQFARSALVGVAELNVNVAVDFQSFPGGNFKSLPSQRSQRIPLVFLE